MNMTIIEARSSALVEKGNWAAFREDFQLVGTRAMEDSIYKAAVRWAPQKTDIWSPFQPFRRKRRKVMRGDRCGEVLWQKWLSRRGLLRERSRSQSQEN